MKIFFSVNIPVEAKEKIFRELTQELHAGKFKRVEKENLHITMQFIGETSHEHTLQIAGKLRELKFRKFGASLEGFGEFSGGAIWVGVKKGKEEFMELAEKIWEITGIREERFTPHLTIARNRSAGNEEMKKTLAGLTGKNFRAEFYVESVSLMESKLAPGGPVYQELEERTFSSSDSGS